MAAEFASRGSCVHMGFLRPGLSGWLSRAVGAPATVLTDYLFIYLTSGLHLSLFHY